MSPFNFEYIKSILSGRPQEHVVHIMAKKLVVSWLLVIRGRIQVDNCVAYVDGLPHPEEIQFLHLVSGITVLESVEKWNENQNLIMRISVQAVNIVRQLLAAPVLAGKNLRLVADKVRCLSYTLLIAESTLSSMYHLLIVHTIYSLLSYLRRATSRSSQR